MREPTSHPTIAETADRVAHNALDTLHNGVDQLSAAVPEALRRSVARAKQAGTDLRTQAGQATASTVEYIQCEPIKAVLIAAAAGAALTALTSVLLRSRSPR